MEIAKTTYAKGEKNEHWYRATFEHLGDQWLFDTLTYLIEDGILPKNFTLASLSANLGFYEKKAYDELKKLGYDIEFYLGDLEAQLEGRVSSYDKFYYSFIGKNASEVVLPNNKKADVILDSKGALWYVIKNKQDLIKLLKNYCNLLKDDDSILLIDRHKPSLLNIVSEATKKWGKLYHFSEFSNYTKFNSVLKFIAPENMGKSFDAVKENPNKLLTKYLKTHYYTKKELYSIISNLEEVSNFKYKLLLLKPVTFSRFCHLLIASLFVFPFVVLAVMVIIAFILSIFN